MAAPRPDEWVAAADGFLQAKRRREAAPAELAAELQQTGRMLGEAFVPLIRPLRRPLRFQPPPPGPDVASAAEIAARMAPPAPAPPAQPVTTRREIPGVRTEPRPLRFQPPAAGPDVSRPVELAEAARRAPHPIAPSPGEPVTTRREVPGLRVEPPAPAETQVLGGARFPVQRGMSPPEVERRLAQRGTPSRPLMPPPPTDDELAAMPPAERAEWEALRRATPRDRAMSAARAFLKDAGLVSAQTLEGIGVLDATLSILPMGGREPEQNLIYRAGAAIRAFADRYLPEDQILRRDFITQVSGALGQSGVFAAGGYGAQAAGLPAGVASYGVPALTGALVGGAEGYREAREAGADLPTAFLSYLANAGYGTTEALPIGHMLSRLARAGGEALTRPVFNALIELTEEGGQEALQQFLSNATARGLYDPDRDLWFGVEQGAKVGGASGAVMSLLTSLLTARRARRSGQAAETPWGQALEANPETAGVGAALEAKAAAGEPLQPEEAALVRQAHEEAQAAEQPGPVETAAALVPPEVTEPPPTEPTPGTPSVAPTEPAPAPRAPEEMRRPPDVLPPPAPDAPNLYEVLDADRTRRSIDEFRQPDGTYRADRAADHERMLAAEFSSAAPNNPNRTLYIVAGGPGSGKSTQINNLDLRGVVRIDPDRLRTNLPEWHDYMRRVRAGEPTNQELPGQLHMETDDITAEAVRRAYEAKTSFLYDSVGRKWNGTQQMVDKALADGYRVRLIYVDVSIDEALARVLDRFHNGPERRRNPPEYLVVAHRDVANAMLRAANQYGADPRVDLVIASTVGVKPGEQAKIVYRNGELINEELWQSILEKSRIDVGEVLSRYAEQKPEAFTEQALADIQRGDWAAAAARQGAFLQPAADPTAGRLAAERAGPRPEQPEAVATPDVPAAAPAIAAAPGPAAAPAAPPEVAPAAAAEVAPAPPPEPGPRRPTDEDLKREYLRLQKASLDRMFGHNAEKPLAEVANALLERGITEIPTVFGPVKIAPAAAPPAAPARAEPEPARAAPLPLTPEAAKTGPAAEPAFEPAVKVTRRYGRANFTILDPPAWLKEKIAATIPYLPPGRTTHSLVTHDNPLATLEYGDRTSDGGFLVEIVTDPAEALRARQSAIWQAAQVADPDRALAIIRENGGEVLEGFEVTYVDSPPKTGYYVRRPDGTVWTFVPPSDAAMKRPNAHWSWRPSESPAPPSEKTILQAAIDKASRLSAAVVSEKGRGRRRKALIQQAEEARADVVRIMAEQNRGVSAEPLSAAAMEALTLKVGRLREAASRAVGYYSIQKAEREYAAARVELQRAIRASQIPAKTAPDTNDTALIDRRLAAVQNDVADAIATGDTARIVEADKEAAALKAQRERAAATQAAAPAVPPIAVGKRDYLLTDSGRVQFRYEVVDGQRLIPSHHPATFKRMPDYPEGVQNRPYHSDKNEQAKVIRQAAQFEPRFVLSTAPDAINGPPILGPENNVVIGGNSRAMTIMRAVDTPGYQTYLQQLIEQQAAYGLELNADAILKAPEQNVFPILVRRVVDSPGDVDTLRSLARAFNAPLTQALNQEAEAVSRGQAVSAETFQKISERLTLNEEATIAEVLRDPNFGREFVRDLVADGVFTRQDVSRYVTATGELNDAGRRAIELTMLGAVVRDPDLLATAPPAMLNKVARALSALVETKGSAAWDLMEPMRDALLLAKRARMADMSVGDMANQPSLFGEAAFEPRVVALAARLATDKPRAFGNRFTLYAKAARAPMAGQRTLGFEEVLSPQQAFDAYFGGPDIYRLTGQAPPAMLLAQAGSVDPGVLGVGPGRFKRTRAMLEAIRDYVVASRTAAAAQPPGSGPLLMPEPIETGAYRRFIRNLGPQRGRAAYTIIRRLERAKAVIMRNLVADTKRWFGSLTKHQKALLFEAAKGIRRDPRTGGLVFGGLQPGGLLEIEGRTEKRAINQRLGVNMPLGEAIQGGRLPGGYLIGELLADRHAIQLWREITPDMGRRMYEEAVRDVPRGREILDDYTALQEEIRVDPLYGARMPPRSREVLRIEYGVEARRPDEVGHVPSILKEPRTSIGRTVRLLHAMRSGHRTLKTGSAAESGLELKDLMAATLAERSSLLHEELKNRAAGLLIPLVLEPHSIRDPMPDGYTEFRLGVLKNPNGFIRWATRNKAWLEEQGVDLGSVIEAAHYAGGKTYRIPKKILPDIENLWTDGAEDADPKYRALKKAADELGHGIVNYVLATYLVRPATTVRNALSESITYAAMTHRDALRAIILSVVERGDLAALARAQFVADLVAPVSALSRDVREAFPPEVMGRTLARDIGQTSLPGLILRYGGFQWIDLQKQRTIYEAVTRAQAHLAYREQQRTGQVAKPFAEFLRDYRRALPPEVEHYAWRLTDTFGSYDYANVGRRLQQVKGSVLGRGILPYPTYYWKLLSSTYRTLAFDPFMGAHNYKALFSGDAGRAATALANMMTGAALSYLFWSIIPDSWDDYPEKIQDADLPPEYQTAGRVKIPWLKSKNDESYWLRVLDLPLLGDVVAAKAMMRGHLDLPTYLSDRFSLGPIASIALLMLGYTNKYEHFVPPGALLGRETAGYTPLAPITMFGRRMADPYKRRLHVKGDTAWDNYMRGFMDNFPGLSEWRGGGGLPKMQIAREREKPYYPIRYPPAGELQKFFVLNVKPIREGARRASIREALRRKTEREARGGALPSWPGR